MGCIGWNASVDCAMCGCCEDTADRGIGVVPNISVGCCETGCWKAVCCGMACVGIADCGIASVGMFCEGNASVDIPSQTGGIACVAPSAS